MEKQVGTLWLMSSTLDSLTQTEGDKHATGRKGKTGKDAGQRIRGSAGLACHDMFHAFFQRKIQ